MGDVQIVERSLSAIDQRIRELENALASDDSSDDADGDDDEPAGPAPGCCADFSAGASSSSSWTSMLKARAKAEGKQLPVGLVAQLRGSSSGDVQAAKEEKKRRKEEKKKRKKEKKEIKEKKRKREDADAPTGPTRAEPDGSSGAPPEFYCECCRIQVNSAALLQEHLKGKKHVQAARVRDARAESRYCEACEVVFTGPGQLAEHCKGRKHKEAARLKQQKEERRGADG